MAKNSLAGKAGQETYQAREGISRRSPLIPTLLHVAGLFLLATSLGFAEILFMPTRNYSVQTGRGLGLAAVETLCML